MGSIQNIPMLSIVETLGIEHRSPVAGAVECKCPFCDSHGYKLHIQLSEEVFRCNKCGTSGGKLTLYSLVRFGRPYTKDLRDKILPVLLEELGLDSGSSGSEKWSKYHAYTKDQISTPYSELSDEEMNQKLEKIFGMPILKLSDHDRENLFKRGLTKLAIINAEYRTVDYARIEQTIPEWMRLNSQSEEWKTIKEKNEVLKKIPMEQLLLFLTLGLHAKQAGVKVSGIPGAFSFTTSKGKLWGLRMYEGILIPIRNRDGRMVAAQVRTENSSRKYMLLSSRGMPEGRCGKSRIHYPIFNHEGLRKYSTTAMITEGPLKADVYCCLAKACPHKALALIGVNSTSDLAAELQANPELSKYYECFDIDKLVNPAVMNGVRKVKKILRENGKEVSSIFWDAATAEHTLQEYQKYASSRQIKLPSISGDCFVQLGSLIDYLHKQKVSVPKELTHWAGDTKGIDDYLYSLQKTSGTRSSGL